MDEKLLADLRKQMLAFTISHTGDKSAAEDVVQEAFVAAYKNIDSFKNQSAFKTWVFAILKNKLIDSFRRQKKHCSLFDQEQVEPEDCLFDETGHWHKEEMPKPWSQPQQSLSQEQFWQVFETCLGNMPAKHAQIFMMREFIGLDSEEICKQMDVSTSNLHVLLYRARIRLRECLEQRWFLEGGQSC